METCMYLAMHTWMRAEPIEAAIERLPGLGYEAIEIAGDPDNIDVNAVNAVLDRTGIRCFGAVTLMTPERSLLAKDPARRARSVAYLKACISMVQALGGTAMSVVPGSVGQLVPEATPDEEWQWAIESLKEVSELSLIHI